MPIVAEHVKVLPLRQNVVEQFSLASKGFQHAVEGFIETNMVTSLVASSHGILEIVAYSGEAASSSTWPGYKTAALLKSEMCVRQLESGELTVPLISAGLLGLKRYSNRGLWICADVPFGKVT